LVLDVPAGNILLNRYTMTGALDTTFQTGGTVDLTASYSMTNAGLLIESAGGIIVWGKDAANNILLKLK